MINPDKVVAEKNKKFAELKNLLAEAYKSNDESKIAECFVALAEHIQENVLEQANSTNENIMNDRQVLQARGAATLTSTEMKYYNEVISSRKFVGIEKLVPPTIINRVFEELPLEYPLLRYIDFIPVGAATQWILRNGDTPVAWWGKLCSEIKELVDEGFRIEETNLFKLSGYIPVCNAMLDLGPEWLDRYVRTSLKEAIIIGLEEGIVAGTGKEMPIGMNRNTEVHMPDGTYAEKVPVVLKDLMPDTLGKKIMSPLSRKGKRPVNRVLMVINPVDYWEKFFGATTMLTLNGTYVYGILPIPSDLVQSGAVPKGKMIAGIAKDYFMGIGSTAEIIEAKEIRIIEDETVFLTRMYANGQPKDNESFIVFDISGLKPLTEPKE